MNFSLLPSMADLLNTGRIWRLLHFLPLALFSLGIGLVLTRKGMIALRMNSTKWIRALTTMIPGSPETKSALRAWIEGKLSVEKRMGLRVWTEEEEARNIREQLEKHIPSKDGQHKGWARYIPVWFCLIFGLVLGWFARSRRYPIEEHRDVQIIQQVSPSEWMMQGRDLPYMRWKCCPDFDCASVVQSGYIAAIVRYEDRGNCKSIYSTGLGFFYHHAGEVWWTKLNHEKEY